VGPHRGAGRRGPTVGRQVPRARPCVATWVRPNPPGRFVWFFFLLIQSFFFHGSDLGTVSVSFHTCVVGTSRYVSNVLDLVPEVLEEPAERARVAFRRVRAWGRSVGRGSRLRSTSYHSWQSAPGSTAQWSPPWLGVVDGCDHEAVEPEGGERPLRKNVTRHVQNNASEMPLSTCMWQCGWWHQCGTSSDAGNRASSIPSCSGPVGRCWPLLAATFLACVSTAGAATDAQLATCTASYEAYLIGRSALIEDCQLGGGTDGEYRSKCPPGMQALIDDAYADCGGLLIDWRGADSIDWDSEMGGRIKHDVAKCGCSCAGVPVPTFAALTLFASWLSIP
jgi:hypothetical protein